MAKETVQTLCQKAQAALAQGDNEVARQLYQQALGLRTDNPDVHYGLATVCFLLNDLTGAAHHFKEVTRYDPLRAGAYINLGAVYNRLERFDEAIPVLRRGIQLDMNRAEGYYNLALVYKRKGQPDLAIQAYREATRINPRMADAHYNIANLYLDKGQFEQAIEYYRHALEIRPEWEKALRGLEQAEASQVELEAQQDQDKADMPGEAPTPFPTSLPANFDPEQTVDPTIHGEILRAMHRNSIDSETHGRDYLKTLLDEMEPAIKELSSCLLYSDSSLLEIGRCLEKFDAALGHVKRIQESIRTSMDKVRRVGEHLLKL